MAAKAGKTSTARVNGTAVHGRAPKRKIIVKSSGIHGRGVYAARKIAKGERIVEYKGERISWREADRRPPSDPNDEHHTFFFSLEDGKRVIDAKVGGNAARWINHSCAPNCETEEEEGRVYIQALRDIKRGEELFYDYGLITDDRITPTLKKQYQCLCGAKDCRGTMLALRKRKKK
jgi:SET domain-containing protein